MAIFWLSTLFFLAGCVVGIALILFLISLVLRQKLVLPYRFQKQLIPINIQGMVYEDRWISFMYPAIPEKEGRIVICNFRVRRVLSDIWEETGDIQYLLKQKDKEVRISSGSKMFEVPYGPGTNILVKSLTGTFFLAIEISVIDTIRDDKWRE